MHAIGDLIWLQDVQGRCLDANPAFESLARTERMRLLGRCLEDVLGPRLAEALWQPDWTALQAGWPCTHEARLTIASVPCLYEITHIPQRDGNGELVRIQSLGRDITQRHQQIEQSLRDSRRQLADIIDFLPDALLAIDRDKRVIIWNQAIAKITGIPPEAMLGQGDYAYTIPFYGERRPQLMDLVFGPDPELERRYAKVTREGDTLTAEGFCNALHDGRGAWILAKAAPLRDADGQVIGAMEVVRDITEQRQAEEALRQSEEVLALFIRHSPIYAYIKEVTPTQSRVLQASDNFEQMIGIRGSDMVGRCMDEFFPPEFAAKISADDWRVVTNGELLRLDEDLGGRHYTSIKFPIAQGGRTLLAGYTIDITESKRLEEGLRQLTRLDPLTQLFNRRYFFTLAEQEYQRFRRYHRPMALCMVDIDHFKSVNDRYGHLVGDTVLCAVAQTLHDNLRQVDILARYGGEEFVILLPETDLQTACASAERLRLAVAERRIETASGPIAVTLSLGVVAIDNGRSMTLEQLLDTADQMLYRAKQAGRNRVEAWDLACSQEAGGC
ncbi:sensor domain-containing diguanylate cyclase [Thermochromatium tepidum]|uniref:Diguanylate cyclase n=1 Tax=Thermochromatium tepidum ATCC 43061 TaxID=316276 RepID=A0A6I6E663_THETI|nr:sensor domain-containing diguanylate cyclase [Thermochromatium tepidum]QGU31988.1 diguanylate cyclase [Thermochromatium tepidum ATCC 43061]